MAKTVEIKWHKPIARVMSDNGLNKSTLIFMANTLKRLYNPYVPFLRGGLSSEVDTYAQADKGVLHYKVLYAGPQYEGDDFNHTTTFHPLATSHWDVVARPQVENQFQRETQRFILGRR